MRTVAALILTLACASTAHAGSLHKCQTKNGSTYYTDKTCSVKNGRDKMPVLDKNADPQQPAPPPPQKKPQKKKTKAAQ